MRCVYSAPKLSKPIIAKQFFQFGFPKRTTFCFVINKKEVDFCCFYIGNNRKGYNTGTTAFASSF